MLVLVGALAYAWDPGAGTPVVPVAAPAQDTPRGKAAERKAKMQPARGEDGSAAKAVERVEAVEPPDWDPEAQDWALVRVVNARKHPVPGASVEFWALRSDEGPHLLWPGTKPVGKTDAEGRLRLPYFVWTAEKLKTTEVSVKVKHLTYVTATAKLRVGPGEQVLVLERGGLLEVSGWIDDKYQVVYDVTPRLERGARLVPGDWMRPEGQRPSTHQVAEGYHSIYLRHARPDGEYFSDVTTFQQERGGATTLHLQLHRARKLRGRLSENVPRPVRGGWVRINLWDQGNRRLNIDRKLEVPIQADGTFAFPSVPIGRGGILAIAQGWVSRKVPEPDSAGPGEAPTLRLQRVDAREDTTDFELQMEKTARFVLTAVNADGAPVPGATLTLWPNVRWGSGGAEMIMPGDHYSAKTDAQGRAVVENLPPEDGTGYEVEGARYALPIDGARGRIAAATLVSGEDTVHRVVLVPKR